MRHNAYPSAESVKLAVVDVYTRDEHLARGRPIEAGDKPCESGFSASCTADNAEHIAISELERDIFYGVLACLVVHEGDIPEFEDIAVTAFGESSLVFLGSYRKDLAYAVCRGKRLCEGDN